MAQNVINSNYFNYSAAKTYLDSCQQRNENLDATKQTIISYLFECCYDILLSCECNVSQSPGYECITRQYGRGKL